MLFSIEFLSGLIGVIIGALISLVGVVISNRAGIKQLQLQLSHEKEREQSNIKKQRLEELHVLVTHWLTSLFSYYLNTRSFIEGKFDYVGTEQKAELQRIESIIDIYSPELRPPYDEVIDARTNMNSIALMHRREYDQGVNEGEKFLKSFDQASADIDKYGESLKAEIAQLARST